jgi:hypothetical protein
MPLDLEALLVRRDLTADRALEMGDVLTIPYQRRSVLVEGSVVQPGPQPYQAPFALDDYIASAGGLSRFARSIDDVRLISSDGKVAPYARDLTIRPGDTIIVPERDFSRAEIVQLVISVAGLALAGATLYVAAHH